MMMKMSLFGRRYRTRLHDNRDVIQNVSGDKESKFNVLVFLNINNSSVVYIDSSKI